MKKIKPIGEIIREAKKEYDRGARIRSAMENDPKFRAFIDSGNSNRVARYVSMAYLISSIANEYFEGAVELMGKYDLVHKKIKTTSNNLTQSFDSFDKAISQLINTQDAKLQLCSDYGIFKAVCDRYMNADERIGDAGIARKKEEL